MSANQEIIKALTPLNGQTFESREDLDSAIYPHFGPLQAYFLGETFRDLADKLMLANWVIRTNAGFVVQLPPQKVVPAAPEPKEEKKPTLRPVALQLLKDIATNAPCVSDLLNLEREGYLKITVTAKGKKAIK